MKYQIDFTARCFIEADSKEEAMDMFDESPDELIMEIISSDVKEAE